MKKKIYSEDDAFAELGEQRSKPDILVGQHSLPFMFLTPDEFEILIYLLIRRENIKKEKSVYYYGKTGDKGRDIIIERKDGTVDLIQCKHYERNVGVGVIRAELSKLFCNVFDRTIAPRPDVVIFYVSSDLTSDAIDLVRSKDDWRKIAFSAMNDHIGKTPSRELMTFAESWWPETSYETGLSTTERLRKHSDLVDEFFVREKVVTGDIKELKNEISIVDDSVEFLTGVIASNAEKGLRKLIEDAEEKNPNLSFTVLSEAGRTTLEVKAKKDRMAVKVGILTFPNTELGKVGAEKLENGMSEGRQVELLEGEFIWEPTLKTSLVKGYVGGITKLILSPTVPKFKVPVRVVTTSEDKVDAVIDLTYLELIRIGRKEIEYRIWSGALAAEFKIVHYYGRKPNVFGLRPNFGRIPPRRVLPTIDLLISMTRKGQLQIISLEDNSTLITVELQIRSEEINDEKLSKAKKLLGWLDTINNEFGLDLRYPDVVNHDTSRVAELIALAIKKGTIAEKVPNGVLQLWPTKKDLVLLLVIWKDSGPTSFEYKNTKPYYLLGKKLDTDEEITVLENVFPTEGLSTLEKRLQPIEDSQEVEVNVICSRIIHIFSKWSKDS